MPDPVDVTTPNDREIRVTRVFDAPRARIFDCHTQPDLVRRWLLGPPGWSMPVCEIDLRVGGKWRYAMRPEGHEEFAFYGEFLEIVPNEKIVQTETFAPFPDDASTNTMTLTERGGITVLRTLVQHQTPEARDMHINSGMEGGMQDAFDRLEQLAISLA